MWVPQFHFCLDFLSVSPVVTILMSKHMCWRCDRILMSKRMCWRCDRILGSKKAIEGRLKEQSSETLNFACMRITLR